MAEDSGADQSLFKSCVALLFFGVPNRGPDNVNLLSLVRQQKNAQLVRELGIESPLLRVIHQHFAQAMKKAQCYPTVVSFYEAEDSETIEASSMSSWHSRPRSGSRVTIDVNVLT
jgi:hypothetical protein